MRGTKLGAGMETAGTSIHISVFLKTVKKKWMWGYSTHLLKASTCICWAGLSWLYMELGTSLFWQVTVVLKPIKCFSAEHFQQWVTSCSVQSQTKLDLCKVIRNMKRTRVFSHFIQIGNSWANITAHFYALIRYIQFSLTLVSSFLASRMT